MNPRKTLNKIRNRRKKRIRSKIYGTTEKPRLSIFRSNKNIYVQLINDAKGTTLVSASTKELTTDNQQPTTQLGELIAKKAAEKGIKKAIFDRGRYKYHGRIRTVAEGARKAGLKI